MANSKSSFGNILTNTGSYSLNTPDEGGFALSACQRQRVALARALYGDPFMVVLDEPNSNLDAEGETALTRAIHGVKNRGGVVVVIAHRPSALAAVDVVLTFSSGRQHSFGAKKDILQAISQPVDSVNRLRNISV